MPIHAPFWRVFGAHFPQMMSLIVLPPKRTILGRNHVIWAINRENRSRGSSTYAKFQNEIFRGYNFTGGRIFHFSYWLWMGLTTVQRYCAACERFCFAPSEGKNHDTAGQPDWWAKWSNIQRCVGVLGGSSCVPVSAIEGRLGGACYSVPVYLSPVSLPSSSGELSYLSQVYVQYSHAQFFSLAL